jgi:hypothetical protein
MRLVFIHLSSLNTRTFTAVFLTANTSGQYQRPAAHDPTHGTWIRTPGRLAVPVYKGLDHDIAVKGGIPFLF